MRTDVTRVACCKVRGSLCDGYEELYPVGHSALYLVEIQPSFRRNKVTSLFRAEGYASQEN
jgi:hypothetical protein